MFGIDITPAAIITIIGAVVYCGVIFWGIKTYETPPAIQEYYGLKQKLVNLYIQRGKRGATKSLDKQIRDLETTINNLQGLLFEESEDE